MALFLVSTGWFALSTWGGLSDYSYLWGCFVIAFAMPTVLTFD